MNEIPDVVIVVLCWTTAFGLLWEAFKKSTWEYRLRWFFMACIFGICGHLNVGSTNETLKTSLFIITLLATIFLTIDIIRDITGNGKRHDD